MTYQKKIYNSNTIIAKLAMYLLLLLSFPLISFAFGETITQADDEYVFHKFAVENHRVYKNKDELLYRRKVFFSNLNFIRKHNQLYENGNVSYSLSVNNFTDMTLEEFSSTVNGYRDYSDKYPSRSKTWYNKTGVNLPSEVNWVTEGYVTPIKNQGQCGDCYAFSAVGALEGQHFKATGRLVSLSEQNLLDCTVSYGNRGCRGGWMDYCFQYVQNNGGINTETGYPYYARALGYCYYKAQYVGSNCVGHVDIPPGDEAALQVAVAEEGPVSVAIDATHASFMSYRSGIYYEPSCSTTDLDHAVLVVGYGTDAGQDYWLVKNSWGTYWGEQGYIRMARNKGNNCGIASHASYPQVSA